MNTAASMVQHREQCGSQVAEEYHILMMMRCFQNIHITLMMTHIMPCSETQGLKYMMHLITLTAAVCLSQL